MVMMLLVSLFLPVDVHMEVGAADAPLFVLLCAAPLAWAQGAYALKVYQQHVIYNNIRLPQWPFVAVFAMSYAVAAIATFGVMIRKIVSAAKGEWDKEVRLGDADPVFAFGKHRGRGLDDVAIGEPDYLDWLLDADFAEDAKLLMREARDRARAVARTPERGDAQST